jgi:hypothetical protein
MEWKKKVLNTLNNLIMRYNLKQIQQHANQGVQWRPETISKTGRVRKAIRLGETIF